MYTVEIWKGIDGQWYWHIVSSRNGKVICTSEGYKRKGSAYKIARNVMSNLKLANIVWVNY